MWRLLLGAAKKKEIEAELSAQVDRILKHEIRVSHLDSHGHLHAYPVLARIVVSIAEKYGIRRIRRSELSSGYEFWTTRPLRVFVALGITAASRVSSRWIYMDRVRSPDRLLGLGRNGRSDVEWICREIAKLAPGSITELMLHPCLPAWDTRIEGEPLARRMDFEVCTALEVRDALERKEIRLVNYWGFES
jgi:predicted glycoside hydrolase/deacetylase ChbG (UPF0249 family)